MFQIVLTASTAQTRRISGNLSVTILYISLHMRMEAIVCMSLESIAKNHVAIAADLDLDLFTPTKICNFSNFFLIVQFGVNGTT